MSLLITGGTGYIGKKLTQKLMGKYNPIYSVGIEELDLQNYVEVLDFLKKNKISKIIHLGWKMENNNEAIYDNIEALNNLLKASEEVQVEKIIFTSTNNVYGTELNGNNFSEEDKTNLDENNKYGISKYLGEELVKYSMNEKACIIRIADVYGPNQNHGNLMKGIISNLENKKNIQLYGEGKRERDYIYIDDVIRGLEFIYENNLTGIFNLGTGVGTSVKRITDIVMDICKNNGINTSLDYVQVNKEDSSKVILNVEKLKNLGFCYNVTIEEGLRKIIEERGIINGKF
ncbi:NAD-dependent epimerase/dehydratase family protein [Fusobacterium pseudoperiodonticum]|uniref:NAD(P)-dependent oxidoreductase n=1 Tax=Fusobacterium pseudoperiodonticum TaxID=2663009 RepID=A0A2D3PQK5_9FUSO|nr:NAD(P)-dependent oxidoreductase [Fusobacterium pseudoperiodonticum]ATV69982.1 NAD(P)-dependent oxidoreductase [Fusobacterium pseudoperiodonticum]